MDVREKLVEIIHKIYNDPRMDFYDLWEMNQEADTIADIMIELGVTVQCNQWIPVKEKLPTNEGVYDVYDSNLGVQRYYFNPDMSFPCWKYVTHWMPMPQPPKGE